MFSILFDRKAKKFVGRLDQITKNRVKKAILSLADNPFPHDSVRVVGHEKTFRIRVGELRILYYIDFDDKTLIIINVDKRSRVY